MWILEAIVCGSLLCNGLNHISCDVNHMKYENSSLFSFHIHTLKPNNKKQRGQCIAIIC